ncbi:MAG: glycosyl transferase family 1 [Deltaproteobacteria bacterium]|nr:glycosyl transferase family 1 [Deltaproteobacteria bacterium]
MSLAERHQGPERGLRLVVVVGMHRSGTSVIARGLRVLGVDLGDRLLPPASDNDKGFWEDIDVVALNEEVLRSFGLEWHTLRPVPGEELPLLPAEYLARGAALLGNKLETAACFGFKDPRTARLLPFWREVFGRLPVELGYVIACRNPVSVANSLSKRDGMEVGKAYSLWLDHMLSCLTQTAGQRRVVVDYDRFLADPEGQLRRLATALKLDFDPEGESFAEFRSGFLEEALRHERHAVENLKREEKVPPGLADLYHLLLEMATDAVPADDAPKTEAVVAVIRQSSGFLGANHYLELCSGEPQALAEMLVERDMSITVLKQLLEGKDRGLVAFCNRRMWRMTALFHQGRWLWGEKGHSIFFRMKKWLGDSKWI